MKKTSIILVIFLLLLFPINIILANEYDDEDFNINEINVIETNSNVDNKIKINSRAAIVFERNSKSILYEKNIHDKKSMASTTKIMTAIIVLQNANLKDTATISQKAANIGGSQIGFKKGDKISIHDLLYALMLKSGNDAAIALAETVSGSVEEFANLMNKKAKSLNLENTHFITPHGLDSDEHYTTAKELAILTDYALTIPKFKEIVSTKSYNLTINGYTRTINNTNELLGYLDGVYGVKTGFTNKAGRCLVTSAKRGDLDIICVVLGADTKKMRSQDSIKLIEYAFKNFQLLNLKEKFEETFKSSNIENYISIIKGKENTINLELDNINTLIAIKKNDIPNIKFAINYKNTLIAPIEKNYKIGNIEAKIDDRIILSQNIYLKNKIIKKNVLDYIIEIIINYSKYINTNQLINF